MKNATPRGKGVAMALCLAPCLAWCPTVLASTTGFEPPVDYPVKTLPEDFKLGDINNDGLMDVVVANSDANSAGGGNSISALIGTGGGNLASVGDFATDDRPEGIDLALIDDDGFLDAVTANHEGNSISVLLGRGDGTFDPAIDTSVAGGPRDVVSHDFDGDGFADFATADFNSGTVTILKGDGAGNATILHTLNSGGSGSGTEQISICNVNGDAHADLVVPNRFSDTVTAFAGDGNGGFSLIDSELAHNEPRFIAPLDLNGDGLDDLFVANWKRDDIQIFVNDGGSDFDAVATLTDPDMESPLGIDLADVNNDGFLDVLAAGTSSNNVHIFFGENDPFTSKTSSDMVLETGEVPIQVATYDMDDDGFLDVFITEGLADSLKFHRSYLGNPGTIVDNGDPGTSSSGTWQTSEGPNPFGTDSLSSGSGAQYTWQSPTTSGDYEVFLWWTVTSDRLSEVDVEVEHSSGTDSFVVDQRNGPNFWHSLGVFSFDDVATVNMAAPNGPGVTACADAVRIVAVPGQPNLPPIAQIQSIAPAPATEGVSVSFEGVVSDPDGTVQSQAWSSSLDGFLADELSFTTSSLSPGTHSISLLAIDNEGATSSKPVFELVITPSPVDPPVANAGDDLQANEGGEVTLDGSASAPSDGGPLTYEWAQISGRTVILQNASLPVATFQAPAVLADQELVFQLTVTEGDLADADTVNVTVHDVGVGMGTFTEHPRPTDITVDRENRLILGFHASMSVANDNEPTDWTRASFRAVGNGDPGAEIVQAWLYLDANEDGLFDDNDVQLGAADSFPVGGDDTIVFDGFVETLLNGESKGFFVVCEQSPEVVENHLPVFPIAGGAPWVPSVPPLASIVLSLAVAALVLPLLLQGSRQRTERWAFGTCLILVSLALPLSGCGGGGGSGASGGQKSGGGNSAQLQLELFDVELTGTNTGQPAAVDGLPLVGWVLQ